MSPSDWNQVKTAFASAVELPADKRADFVSTLSDNVRAVVQRLLHADANAGGFILEPAIVDPPIFPGLEVPPIPDEIDNYKIIRKIGSGGMGVVYLGERDSGDFQQRVALKFIKRGMDTEGVLRRFLSERRILAELDHPNIARLIDGGTTREGLPYFVMEYVEGTEIRDYCTQNDLGLDARLDLFRKICSAVQRAHGQLVVHRDLKPTNILVTRAGDPKLLDFGISKVMTSDPVMSEATVTEFRVLTPEYASPEHIAGKPTSTSADIYSLGVMLYELLTGYRPYPAKVRTTVNETESSTSIPPPKPSSIFEEISRSEPHSTRQSLADAAESGKRDRTATSRSIEPKLLRGDLDNIILKAIRQEPERRYRSVQEFSDDIERFLQGLPVKATADSRGYRLRKFVDRNRWPVMAAVLVGIVLIAATAITSWQYSIARRERAKAEQRFQDVRRLANTILFDHYERIKELPGATEARAKLASDALQYLDSLSAETEDDPGLLREVATAYKRLGEVQNSAYSGGNLGDAEAAKASYLKAHALWERIDELGTGDINDKESLADSYVDVSELFQTDMEKRRDLCQKGLTAYRAILDDFPDQTKIRSGYATALWYWAWIVRTDEGDRAGLDVLKQSVAIREKLLEADPRNTKVASSASLTYKNIGTLYQMAGDLDQSLEYYLKARVIDLRLLEADPQNVRLQLAVSFTHKGISTIYSDRGDLPSAIRESLEAIKIQESVVNVDKKNNFAAQGLARSYGELATFYQKAGDDRGAKTYFARAYDLEKEIKGSEGQDMMRRAVLDFNYGKFLLGKSGGGRTARAEGLKQLEKAASIFAEAETTGKFDAAYTKQRDDVRSILLSSGK